MPTNYRQGTIQPRDIFDNSELVAQCTTPAHAEFIIRCVNSHDDLLEACKRLVQMFAYDTNNRTECQMIHLGKAAIARAKGEKT